MQKKLLSILSTTTFWSWFLGGSTSVFLLETFFLGMWTLPIVEYQIPYMAERTTSLLWFAGGYALLFGFGLALFFLARASRAVSCSIASSSGVLTMFTMLCPICPVFFLAYFGASATVLAFAPYFWAFRIVAVLVLLTGVVLLWKKIVPESLHHTNPHTIAQSIAILLMGILLIGNQTMAIHIGQMMMGETKTNQAMVMSGDFAKDIATLVTPTTLPFYGIELGLDMSNVNAINASIAKLSIMAPMQGSNPIQLNEEEMQRYIAIGTEPYVTCEFCCGVKTLVRKDGSPTCGCAHSIAMRGTTAYLIKNHPELTNTDIAYELMRQKGLYFPTQMQQRMATSLAGETKDFLPDIKYLTMKLSESEMKNLGEKAKSSGFKPETKSPDMVGGC